MNPQQKELATEFLRPAQGHLEAARIIGAHVFPKRPIILAYCNVVGFSLELYLKAYLATQAVEYKTIKDLRHDLNALYTSALDVGFMSKHKLPGVEKSATDRLVNVIHENHAAYTYRYPRSNTEITYIDTMASRESVHEILERLDTLIQGLVR